jgi:membrane protein implicated in regulation of membrane protease activity
MDLIALIIEYGGWSWIIAGFVLLAIELVVPGGIVVWFGVAALLVGLATLTQALGWQMQWILIAFISVASVFIWTRFFKSNDEETDRPFLNARHTKLVGNVYTLAEPIENGAGRLKIDDSFWRIKGPDLPAGSKVKVVSTEPTILEVEAI